MTDLERRLIRALLAIARTEFWMVGDGPQEYAQRTLTSLGIDSETEKKQP